MSHELIGEILYENLDYGAYILEYDSNPNLTENVRYNLAEFNKLHVRRIRLPDGKGNIVYSIDKTPETGKKSCFKIKTFV